MPSAEVLFFCFVINSNNMLISFFSLFHFLPRISFFFILLFLFLHRHKNITYKE